MKDAKYILLLVVVCSLISCSPPQPIHDPAKGGKFHKVELCAPKETAIAKQEKSKINIQEQAVAKHIDVYFNSHEPIIAKQEKAKFNSQVKGIYISQKTIENREYLQYLINRSKQAGINTFIIDLSVLSDAYQKNILLVKNNNIRYVARIEVFPYDEHPQYLSLETYWVSRYRLVDVAIRLGADEVQLDYIRHANEVTAQKAQEIQNLIAWFKSKIGSRAKLQIDVFATPASPEVIQVGSHLPNLQNQVDAICPMLGYNHGKPYETIYTGLKTIRENFHGKMPFSLYPYIELSNHQQLNEEQLLGYIQNQIRAAEDAHADGWYAWSANNKYERLFKLLSAA